MDLRYRLAVVTSAGAGLGREIAVALSRVGAAVLSADRDLAAAEGTAELVRQARVGAWALQVDLADEDELRMLAARARDLGGMDLLVTLDLRASTPLTQLFVEGLPERRGRRDGSPAVVIVGRATTRPELVRVTTDLADRASSHGARVMAVAAGAEPPATVTGAVVALLSTGTAGEVVQLGDG
jgi:hypothetical protein